MHGPSSLDDNLHKKLSHAIEKAATAFAYIIGKLLVNGFCMKKK